MLLWTLLPLVLYPTCDVIKAEYRKTCCPAFAPELREKAGTGRLCTGSILSMPCPDVPPAHCDCTDNDGSAQWTDGFCAEEEEAALLSETYDVIIVGSGPGGFGAALAAHDTGLKALVLERGRKPSDIEANELKDTGYMTIGGGRSIELNGEVDEPVGWINVDDSIVYNRSHRETLSNAVGGGYTMNGLIYNIDATSFAKNPDLYETAVALGTRLGLPTPGDIDASMNPLTDEMFDAYGSGGVLRQGVQSRFITSADSKQTDRRAAFEDFWPTDVSVLANTTVDTVVFEGLKAVGVRLADGREVRGRHIVLAAGYSATAAMLQRSGIGPADLLEEHGIVVRADLSVGEGLRNEVCFNTLAYIDNFNFASDTANFRTFLSDDGRTASQPAVFNMSALLPFDFIENTGTVFVNSFCSLNSALHPRQGIDGSVRIKSADPDDIPRIDFGVPMDDATAASIAEAYNLHMIPFLQSLANRAEGAPSSDFTLLKTLFGDFLNEVSPGIVFGRVNGETRLPMIFNYTSMTAEDVLREMEASGEAIYHGMGGTAHLLDPERRGKLDATQNLYLADSSALQNFPWSAGSLFLAHGYETVQGIASSVTEV